MIRPAFILPLLVLLVFSSHLYGISPVADTIPPAGTDSVDLQKESQKGELESPIQYSARDSIRFDNVLKKVYLFGEARIDYQSTVLEAPYIEIDWDSNVLHAETRPDSLGKPIKPNFTDDGESFSASAISYNFKTKKGKIREVITREGDGFVHGRQVKKDTSNVYYIKGGDYTTCDLDHPHFALHASRLKVIPDDKIITGPAYLQIEDVPTPLALPFGIFPIKKGRRSGILMPTYGESRNQGFFLKNGGYYFALGEYLDLQLRGDIYSLGSWGTKAASAYRKKYRYNGRVEGGYSSLKFSDPEFPDYRLSKDYFIRWSHSQDPKARPNSRFNANVNLNSGRYFRNNSYNANDVLSNEYFSSITYAKAFAGSPFNLSMNLRHRQNTQTHAVNMSLPEVAFTMNRINPFKDKAAAKRRWYDNIGLSYTMNARNDIQTVDSVLFTPASLKGFRNGVRHTVPVSSSFKVFRYFTFSPSATYNERWYFTSVRKQWTPGDTLITDTLYKFQQARDYTAGASLTTKVYGLVAFKEKHFVRAIRHVITPSFGFGYRPDYGLEKYGYYEAVQTDTTGLNFETYSIFENGIFGGPPRGKSGSVNFNVQNNLEMKIRPNPKDTANQARKVKLIENLSIGTAYDLARDSLNLSRIAINARTSIFKNTSIIFGSIYDPYVIDSAGRNLERWEWEENGRPARLVAMNTGINFSLSHHSKKTQKDKGSVRGTAEEKDMVLDNPNDYVDFSVPWSLNVAYNLTYSKPIKEPNITQSIGFSGDLSITGKWKTSFNSGYDFKAGKFTYTSIQVYRDLHCWQMSFTWIPFGFRQSYNLTINVKSAVLQDLKLTRRRDWYDQ